MPRDPRKPWVRGWIAVLDNDPTFGNVTDLGDLPSNLVDRLDHYFQTYKRMGDSDHEVAIEARYGAEEAHRVVDAALADYEDAFGD